MFGIYLVILYYNTKLGAYINDACSMTSETESETTPLLTNDKPKLANGKCKSMDMMVVTSHSAPASAWGELDQERGPRMRSLSSLSLNARKRLSSISEEEIEETWVDSSPILKWVMMPIMLLFKITIPKPTSCCFMITFIISIIWISALTYLTVWMCTIIGELFGSVCLNSI